MFLTLSGVGQVMICKGGDGWLLASDSVQIGVRIERERVTIFMARRDRSKYFFMENFSI